MRRNRRRSGGIAAAVLALLLVVCSGIALAADSADPGSDEAGLATSAQSDPVELKGERTATSQTFQLPDGSREARIYEAPINYRDEEGRWQPIEAGFEEAPTAGVRNGDNGFDLRLPDDLSAEPVRMTVGDDWVAQKPLGLDTDEVELEGDVATYAGAGGDSGASFELTGLPNGLKENIEIADPSAPSTFHFQLTTSEGLTPELTRVGSIEVRDGDGKVVVTLPAPVMTDSAFPPQISAAVRYELEPDGQGAWRLTVEADREWLAQPERSWPVEIDPSMFKTGAPDQCVILNVWTDAQCSYPLLAISWQKTSGEDWLGRSLLNFNLGAIPAGAAVIDAKVGLYAEEAAQQTSGVQLRRVLTGWNTTVTWKNATCKLQPSYCSGCTVFWGCTPWNTPGGDFNEEGAEILTSQRGSQPGWWIFEQGITPIVQGWLSGEKLPAGLILKLKDEAQHECNGSTCAERTVVWASNTNPDAAKRPYIAIDYYPPAPASSKVVSPMEGTTTARRLKLKAKWEKGGVTGITWQYREGKAGPFQTIPSELVRKADGQPVPSWPMALSGVFESEPLYFDAAHASATLRNKGGPIQVRALFDGSAGVEGVSAPVEAKVNRFLGGPKDATASVGPGSVDLLTGNLAVSRSDVSVPAFNSTLEFSRTYNSRGLALKGSEEEAKERKSPLGPGWKPGVPVEEAGGSAWRSVKEVHLEETIEGVTYPFDYAALTTLDGIEIPFEKDEVGNYVTPPEMTGWRLSKSNGNFLLADPGGNQTTFSNLGGGTEYVPVSIAQTGGSGNSTTVVWQLVEGNKRLQKVIAPSPPGVSCTAESALSQAGCKALVFDYEAATTWGAPADRGERLARITLYAGTTISGVLEHWKVAAYNYDTEGRLTEAWDPRISPPLKEKYAYEGKESESLLKTITPPGQEPWTMEYGAIDEELANGRLTAVKRPTLLASPSVAQTTIVYGVPVSGPPYNMSGAAVSQWAQQDIPVDATAVFPPDQVPSSNPPESYSRATVYYMDSEGYGVNTATPSGAGTEAPSISTAETDEFGNVVRELTPQNRLRALAQESEAKRIEKAKALDTHRQFNADGTEMREEWGPLHQVRLESGTTTQARLHKTVEYDDLWPGTGVKPHLPTRETTGASIPNQGIDADQRVTKYEYNWNLRRPTATIVDPGEGHLNIKSVTVYDESSGLPIERRQPSDASGGGAGTTKIRYYSAGTQASDPACQSKPAWANLPCATLPAAQPGTAGLPPLTINRIASYNSLGEPTETVESFGALPENVRRTKVTYDAAGRPLTRKIEGGGTPVPKTETLYSSTLGMPTKQRFVCETGCTATPTYLSSFGSAGTGNGQFSHPAGIALDSKGNLWVVDQNNDRVQKFNAAGEYQSSFGSSGTGNGQFGRPTDIAVDSNDNLWVTDAGNHRVETFNDKGEFRFKFGTQGSGNGQFNGAEGIAIDASDYVWVADTYNGRLQKFGAGGDFAGAFSSKGSGAGQLGEPTDLDIGPGGKVWVADWQNNRVAVFNQEGGFLQQFGTQGSGNGQFQRPDAIDVDPQGNVWVGDQNNSRVQQFDQSGGYVAQFGTFGSGAGQFSLQWPMGLLADGEGSIWVSDTNNNRVQKWNVSDFDRQATTTTYDTLGRPTSYEDADGNTATTTYDLLGRPATVNDGKGTQTMSYDATSGLLVELQDSAAGTFTAAYNADGNLTARGLPNGLVAETTYDEVGAPTHLTYNKVTSCAVNCKWLDFGAERSIYGQVLAQTGTLSRQQFKYDRAGRLELVRDWNGPEGGSCATREYKFEGKEGEDSNRTKLITRAPGIGGACAESGGTEQSYTYDTADRLIGGPTYDSWGRITSLPGAMAGGSTLTTSYFSTDMVATQSQGGITNTFQLDAALRQRQRIQGGGLEGTEVFHYAGGSDSPVWTERGSAWSRNIVGIGGELAAIQESGSGVSLQLTNLHGDVTATASLSQSATGPTATFEYDEFGNPKQGSTPRFGWLGGKSRRTELPSGVVQMGARSYVPAIGRFISMDPVRGGSANTYDYVNQDPVNDFDLGGEAPACNFVEPSVRAKKPVSKSGHFTVQVRAWARCSRGTKNVNVKAVITGGRIRPAPGVTIPIPAQSGPSTSCGNAGVKFSCPATAQVPVDAQPPCGDVWPGEVNVRFFLTWETRSGKTMGLGGETTLRFNVYGVCK